jgi:hypothetical protein
MPYQPQVTKCPGSRFGASFVSVPSLRRRSVGRLNWCALRSKIKSHSVLGRYEIPVGDAGGHDGSDSGLSVADESPDLPSSSDRGPACQSSSVSHRVPCTAGNLDTPRNRGAADRALANARPVSPSASYLKGHQVTKCPGSWLGSSFVGIPSLRRRSVGPPPSAIHGGGRLSRHPCRSAHCATPAFSLHPSRDLCRPD